MDKLKVFVGSSHPELGELICSHLNIKKSPLTAKKFANGETCVQLNTSVRNKDVYIVQSTTKSQSINDSIMELLILISACKTGSAARITAVIPDFFYGSHSKMTKSRSSITARMMADLITMSGADHVVSMDLKAGQMQGFFNKPVDNLYCSPILAAWIRSNIPNHQDVVIVSKDPDGTKKVAELADRLKVSFAMVNNDLVKKGGQTVSLVGNVREKPVIILDDLLDKPEMILIAAEYCKKVENCREVIVAATHGVFLGDCLAKLNSSENIDRIIVTNTHPIADRESYSKLQVIDVSFVFAECIRRLHNGESISQLFNYKM